MLDFIGGIFNSLISFIGLIANFIGNTFNFVIGIFTYLPKTLISLTNNLPGIFRAGLSAMIGVMLVITIIKLYSLIKSMV